MEAVATRSARPTDGPTALAVAAVFRPDVALLDIGLPGLDGHEVCGPPLAMRAARGIRVIAALTGYGQPADRERGTAHRAFHDTS